MWQKVDLDPIAVHFPFLFLFLTDCNFLDARSSLVYHCQKHYKWTYLQSQQKTAYLMKNHSVYSLFQHSLPFLVCRIELNKIFRPFLTKYSTQKLLYFSTKTKFCHFPKYQKCLPLFRLLKICTVSFAHPFIKIKCIYP